MQQICAQAIARQDPVMKTQQAQLTSHWLHIFSGMVLCWQPRLAATCCTMQSMAIETGNEKHLKSLKWAILCWIFFHMDGAGWLCVLRPFQGAQVWQFAAHGFNLMV